MSARNHRTCVLDMELLFCANTDQDPLHDNTNNKIGTTTANRTVSDKTRFNFVVAALVASLLQQIYETARNLPQPNKYEVIKAAIIFISRKASSDKHKSLPPDYSRETKKPSHFLNESRHFEAENRPTRYFWSCDLDESRAKYKHVLQPSNHRRSYEIDRLSNGNNSRQRMRRRRSRGVSGYINNRHFCNIPNAATSDDVYVFNWDWKSAKRRNNATVHQIGRDQEIDHLATL